MGLKSIPLAKIIFDFFFFSRQKERTNISASPSATCCGVAPLTLKGKLY